MRYSLFYRFRDTTATDYGRAIGLHFSSAVFLMSLPQIRNIYPEFREISDADLLEGLREKFYPNMTSSDFVGEYAKNIKPYQEFTLSGLYENRGDAYLASNNFRKASHEYIRARQTDSNRTIDRWKLVSAASRNNVSIDFQTADFINSNAITLWVKTTTPPAGEYMVQKFRFNCAARKIRLMGFVKYDTQGTPQASSDEEMNWELIVPDSVGEGLANGACVR